MYRLVFPIALAAMTVSAEAKPARKHATATQKAGATKAKAKKANSTKAKPGATRLDPPAVGDEVTVLGERNWPRLEWLNKPPTQSEAAGKVVLHWFCTRKAKICAKDHQRVSALAQREHIYVVAHVAGTKGDANKLDPIGKAGSGAISYGKATTTLMKRLRIGGDASILVDVDGKVAFVSTSGSNTQLDTRDAKIDELVKSIKNYTISATPSTASAKPGEKVQLTMTAQLASWLTYSTTQPSRFKLNAVPALACETRELTPEAIRVEGQTLTATVTCSAPAGKYEIDGELQFGYETSNGTTTNQTEHATWTLEVEGAQAAAAAVQTDDALQTGVTVHRARPPKLFGFIAVGTPLYTYVKPPGKPSLTFNPTTQLGVLQNVGIGYIFNRRLTFLINGVFVEVVRADNSMTGWSFGSINAIVAYRLWNGLYAAGGVMGVYRRFYTSQREWGLAYELGYRFNLPATFSLTVGANSPQVYQNTLTIGATGFVRLSHPIY